jgi:two-component system response regulator
MEQVMDKRTILLVEDNADDEQFVFLALKANKIDNPVVVARDGQEAIDHLFDTASELPAFVLLDLHLPRIGGLQVLEQVRAHPRTKHVPVIILTSSRQDSDLIAGYALGCNNYICKPLDFNQFIEMIATLCRLWLEFNECPPVSTG